MRDVTVWTPEEEANASIGWLFIKIALVGALISIPMALIGVVTKADGVSNGDAAMKGIEEGHSFIWVDMVAPTVAFVVDSVKEWSDDTN